jgi:hypothetical protein
LGQHVRLPQPRERAPNVEAGGTQLWGQGALFARWRLNPLGLGGFRSRQGAEGRFPAPLQCGGEQSVVGIDPVALAFTERGLIPSALVRLPVRLVTRGGVLARRGHRLRVDVEFHGGQRGEKGLHDPCIDWISQHILPDRDAILLPQVVPEGLGPPCILHHHLVAAGAAIDEAMEPGFARPGEATGFMALRCGVVVMQHGLHLFDSRPADVREIRIVDPNASLLPGETLGGWASWRGAVL